MPVNLHNLRARDVDINHGIDFERAREHLAAQAGEAYRTYVALADAPQSDPQTVEAAWDAYCEASRRRDSLRRSDEEEIARILRASTSAGSVE